MKISEIFYSLQGEGRRAGEASLFVRLAGCDLACGFCDTEFESGKEMTNHELLDYLAGLLTKATGTHHGQHWIVWTGGEPTLQLNADIIEFFKVHGFKQAIETNGNHVVPEGIDWVVVSPKVAEHVLKKNFPNGVNELRYVRHSGQLAVPEPAIKAEHYYLSPRFNGDQPDIENMKHCIQLCLQNPKWKLSLQSHKLTRIL